MAKEWGVGKGRNGFANCYEINCEGLSILYLNGVEQEEPYVKFKRARWNLKPRKVAEGHYYVIGDNRSMPMYQHKFGEIRQTRLEGALLL